MGGAIGSAVGKIGDFASGAGDIVKGTGQSVGELKDIGYSPADIANLGGGEMTAAQKVAKGLTGAIGGGLKALPSQQPRGAQASPIQVTPTPDVSGFYPQKPIMPQQPGVPAGSMPYTYGQNDPYSAFYGR